MKPTLCDPKTIKKFIEVPTPPKKPLNLNYVVGGLLMIGFLYLYLKIQKSVKNKEEILPNRITLDTQNIQKEPNLRIQKPGVFLHDKIINQNNYQILE